MNESTPELQPQQQVTVSLPPFTPWLTYGIMGVTIVVFLAQLITEYLVGFDLPAAYGIKSNFHIIEMGQLWRLFTPMLLHGGFVHIGFNMYALKLFGPELERFFGRKRFFLLYVLAGFAGNVFSMILTPNLSLGSSTAIFGLLGAQAVFVYTNRTVMGERSGTVLRGIIQIALINFVIGLSPGIDNWAHLGGMIGGAAFAWLAGPRLVVEGMFSTYTLVDQRQEQLYWVIALLVGAFFAALAYIAVALGWVSY